LGPDDISKSFFAQVNKYNEIIIEEYDRFYSRKFQ